MNTPPEWPRKHLIPADRGIKVAKFGFLGVDYNHSVTRQTDNGEPFRAFIPAYIVLLLYHFQPWYIGRFLFRSYSRLCSCLHFLMQNVCWPFISQLSIKCQDWPAAFGLISTHAWDGLTGKKAPRHRRWLPHAACEAWRSSGCLTLWRAKQQDRGQSNTNTKICIVPRGTPASSSSGEAVGDCHSGSSTAWRNTQDKYDEGSVSLAQDKMLWSMWTPWLNRTRSTKLKTPSPLCWLLFCIPVCHLLKEIALTAPINLKSDP